MLTSGLSLGVKNEKAGYRLIFALFALFTISSQGVLLSQNSSKDSCLVYLSRAIDMNQGDVAIAYGREALRYAKETGDDSLLMQTYYWLSKFEVFRGGVSKSAFAHADSAYVLGMDLNDTLVMYKCLKVKGIAESMQSNSKSAHEYFIRSLELATLMKDTALMASSYNAIGKNGMHWFDDSDENGNSKSFFLKALEYYKKLGADPARMATVYRNLADATPERQEKLKYYSKALQIALENDDRFLLADLYFVRGRQELIDENIDTAIYYLQKALPLTDESDMITHNVGVLLHLVDSYMMKGQWEEARKYFDMFEMKHNYRQLMASNREYYLGVTMSLLAHEGRIEEAYNKAREMIELQDSISEAEMRAQQIRYMQEFELDKKNAELAQKELALVESSNQKRQLIFGGITLLLLFAGWLQWYYFQQKRRRERVESDLQKEQELNRVRTEFLENIAHEIRTPITLVNGYLKIALKQIRGNHEVEKNLNAAISSSDRVLKNANEILELLRFDHSKVHICYKDVSAHRFLKRVFYSFESLAEIKRIELQFSTKIADDVMVRTDSDKLEKIINNFVSNAIKYSPSDSSIIFNAEITNERLVVSVRDFGPGIKKQEQSKIFKRFYQASNTSNVGGVGIGLALALELAQLMGGEIRVESKEDKGSIFILDIPVDLVDKSDNSGEKENSKKVSEGSIEVDIEEGKTKVLIVEDNPEMNEYLKTILCQYFSCDIAFDGEEGLRKVQTRKYGLIISDVMMPRMDGLKFKQSINGLANYKNIPFIFITAKAMLDDKIEGFSLGVDDYITKPFQREELLVRVQVLLKNKKERELWLKDNLDFVGENEDAVSRIMNKVKKCINDNMANEDFRVSDLAKEIGFSQRQLARIIKKSVGLSPVRFILEMRLQKAYLFLVNKQFATLSEVRHRVGISSRPYFNKKFYERFGVKPSDVFTDN